MSNLLKSRMVSHTHNTEAGQEPEQQDASIREAVPEPEIEEMKEPEEAEEEEPEKVEEPKPSLGKKKKTGLLAQRRELNQSRPAEAQSVSTPEAPKAEKPEKPKKEKKVREKRPKAEKPIRPDKENELPEAPESGPEYDEWVTMAAEREELERIAKERRSNLISTALTIFFVIASLYMVLLIYGTIITKYQYDKNGQVHPVRMTASDLEKYNEFKTMQNYYTEARRIYEEVLLLDYRLSTGEEDSLILATEYQAITDDIDKLGRQIKAENVRSEYTNLMTLEKQWIVGDYGIGIYCDKMSSAITMNNQADANAALVIRSQMQADWRQLTQNMVVIGSTVKGADVSELSEWSEEQYIHDTVFGKTGGN